MVASLALMVAPLALMVASFALIVASLALMVASLALMVASLALMIHLKLPGLKVRISKGASRLYYGETLSPPGAPRESVDPPIF